MAEPGQLDLREGLHRLSRGLIAYGVVGLVVAAIGIGALAWVNDRVTHIRSEDEATAARQASTLQLAAKVVRDASSTVRTFSTTADQAAQGVAAAAVSMTEVRSTLSNLEGQLRSVSILGATPLSPPADAVGQIAASMTGLDARLSLVADGLKSNRDALASNSASLLLLANSTAALAGQVGSGDVQDSLGEAQLVMAVTLLVTAAWSCVPAAGALALGLWLRRVVGRPGSA